VFTLYRLLLHLYPPAHRDQFGEEMTAVFLAVQKDTRTKSMLARSIFYACEVKGLLGGAVREHVRAVARSHDRLLLSRRFTMRSEFRFPKTTVALMTVILAAVLLAIEKAKAIQSVVPYSNPHVGPVPPAEFTLWPLLIVVFAGACTAGATGWAILFALRRSGTHRLAECDPVGNNG
jgi:hypothetical protein